MEHLLHLSYRLEFQSWQMRGQEMKEMGMKKKMEVQTALRESIGINVDIPKTGGAGNSNDGNCARRFFSNYEEVSRILGISPELIKRYYVTLCVLSSTFEVDAEKLEEFNKETIKLYLSLYSWYYIPQAVHKMLVHSHQVSALINYNKWKINEK